MQIICVFWIYSAWKWGQVALACRTVPEFLARDGLPRSKSLVAPKPPRRQQLERSRWNSYKKWNDLEHVNKYIFLLKYGAYKVSFIGGTGVGSDMWMGGGRGDTSVLQNRETCIKTSFVTAGTVPVLLNQWMHKYSFVSFI